MKFTTKKSVAVVGGIDFPQPLGIEIHRYNIRGLQPKSWIRKFEEINQLIKEKYLHGIIIYLATPLFLEVSKPEYFTHWINFLRICGQTKSIIIVYEENIHENFNYYDYEEERYLSYPELLERILVIETELVAQNRHPFWNEQQFTDEEIHIILSGAPPIPDEPRYGYSSLLETLRMAQQRIEDYHNRKDDISSSIDAILSSEVSLKTFKEKQSIAHVIEDFLFDIIKDVFFSIYVSNEQILHEEFSDFVKVFEKYMRNIEGVSFIVDADSSPNGTTYYFKSKTLNGTQEFSNAIRRFDKFIEVYLEAPEEAAKLVAKEYANSIEVFDAMQGIIKKYQRLLLDIKHQQERIKMLMRQDFENFALEKTMYNEELNLLNSKGLIKDSTYFIGGKVGSFGFDASAEGYSKNDAEILKIVAQYGSKEDLTLIKSSIDKLKDEESSQTDKISSSEKIKGFLIKALKKTGEHAENIGVKVLTTYLDNLVKGTMQ
ncbi:hypothetical protein GCM10027048_23640 [Hymenobacter coalescens]